MDKIELGLPFEFICEVTGAGPMAKARHVQRSAAASRHSDIQGELFVLFKRAMSSIPMLVCKVLAVPQGEKGE